MTSPFSFFKKASGVLFGGESSIFIGPILVFMVYDVPATLGMVIVCGLGVFSKKNSFGLLVSPRFSKIVTRGGKIVSCFTILDFGVSCLLFEQEE